MRVRIYNRSTAVDVWRLIPKPKPSFIVWWRQQVAHWVAENKPGGEFKQTDRQSFFEWLCIQHPQYVHMPTRVARKKGAARATPISTRKCNRKTIYDKRGAETVKNERERQGAERLRIYHCEKCNGWHLTHTAARTAA